jgi:hypothetical protein
MELTLTGAPFRANSFAQLFDNPKIADFVAA